MSRDIGQAISGEHLPARTYATLARLTCVEWLSSQSWPDPGDSVSATVGSLRSGVDAKVLYHDAIRDDPAALAHATAVSAAGAQVRTTSAELPTVAIIDRRQAIIMHDHADVATTATMQPAIIATLAVFFEQAWHGAVPLSDLLAATAGRDPADIAATQRELLRLLASGATDETASRQLGLSLRTTRRHMASLMSHLGATSRFQAGAEAVRRGWLA